MTTQWVGTKSSLAFSGEWALLVMCALAAAAWAAENSASEIPRLRIPVIVRGASDRPYPLVPLWTGVPLPRGTITDAAGLRLVDEAGRPVPVQCDVQARWPDGSVKWVLVSFAASSSPPPPAEEAEPRESRGRRRSSEDGDRGGPSRPGPGQAPDPPRRFILTFDPASPAAAAPRPVSVREDTNSIELTTGPLLLRVSRHGFTGLGQVFLDLSGDGRFDAAETVVADTPTSGLVAEDRKGVTYSSRQGQVRSIEVERRGPMQAVAVVRGDLRAEDAPRPLLNYVFRLHAFAGSSLVRVVLTVHNPRPAGRSEDGGRWGLGQTGSVLLKYLDFRQAIRLPAGHRRVSLSSEPGRLLDRIPLAAPMAVYQDSSGGENWFHRAHVNRDDLIPLAFRGYRISYQDRSIDSGLRASPWLDVSDMGWGVSAAMPLFWQNFPKSLGVDADGGTPDRASSRSGDPATIRLGLWPEQSKDLHEIQGGEQKTHEFWLYFRHRAGDRRNMMPLDREMMPVCLDRPLALAGSEAFAAADALDPIVPARVGRFARYEQLISAAARGGPRSLYTDREQADEYGWRHFGDTPANNERDQTRGPYQGLIACSHYNNEYDLGLGMITQAVRTADADGALVRSWYELGIQALWHEADIDIYHTTDDLVPIYQGGTFTHTAHGVDAGRSNHRASPTDEMWGRLNWDWGRGGGTESGHVRSRGLVNAYLLTGDRHLLDAAREVAGLIAFKVGHDRFAQIDIPDRCAGNNLQVLLDEYLLSGRQRELDLCEKIVAHLAVEKVRARAGDEAFPEMSWSACLYLKSLCRFIDVMAQKGVRHDAAIAQHLEYARMVRRPYDRPSRRRGGTWSLLACEVMMQAAALTEDAAEKEKFLAAAQAAFHAVDDYVRPDGTGGYWNSKSLTMLLQGGGLYMRHALAGGEEGPAAQPSPGPQAATDPVRP